MPKKRQRKPKAKLEFAPEFMTAEDVRKVVLTDNEATRKRFRKTFTKEIRETTALLARAQNDFRRLEQVTPVDHRPATVLFFLHGAFNSLLTSLHLLISGFPVPAGNMMRHYSECLAMAMLCTVEKCGIYERYRSRDAPFRAHKAVSTATQGKMARALEDALGVDPVMWKRYADLMKFFDEHSHASDLAMSYALMFGGEGGLVLGAEFDPKKRKQYKVELSSRKQAAHILRDVINRVSPLLPKKAGSPGANES